MNDAPISLETRVEFLIPLNKLGTDSQARLLRQAEVLALRKKDRLFEQGDHDDYTFYLLDGEIEMFADGSLIRRVIGGEGASFQPLAQLQPRQMSAVARSRAQVLRVSRSLLEQLLSVDQPAPTPGSGIDAGKIETTASRDWLLNLLQSEFFRRIPQAHLQTLLDTLETVSVTSQTVVVQQGQPGDYFYIVKEGTCEVVRTAAKGREIRLAELGPGDTFGEEALVSGTARNASVRMTSDGELARLTQRDFARLLQAPLLDAVSRAEADRRIGSGARWLDVRFEDEHAHNGLPGSLNIPLSQLRSRSGELPTTTPYVAYCDSGGRSSAAAFLLAGRGYEACFVTGGAVDDALPEPAAAQATMMPTAPDIDDMVEINARASALEAELERARLTIERAQRMMAEAETRKADADRIVARKLAAERARLDADSAELARKLGAAERLHSALASREQAAREEVTRRQSAVEQRVRQLETEARQRLHDEQQRLAALYQKQADALETLQADRESELRTRLQKELAAERGKLTQEFLRTAAALEQAREERRQALAAKDAATAEAQSLIAEFKDQQERLIAEQEAAFERERGRLQAEALRLEALHRDAAQARQEAETARAAARRALEQAQARQPAAALQSAELNDFAHRAAAAEHELHEALAAEAAAASAARENQNERDRSYGTAIEINLLLQQELDEWVTEQTRLQESTLQQETLAQQKEMTERIRRRAAAAKLEHDQQTRSLLDEIEQQLRSS